MSKHKSKLYGIVLFLVSVLMIFAVALMPKSSTMYTAKIVEKSYIKDIVQHDKFSNQVYIDSRWGKSQGIGIGYVMKEERGTPPENRSQTEEFYLGEKKFFEPLLILSVSKKIPILVSVILDYKQIPFELDGQMGLLHEVNISPVGDFEIPIRVPINSPGKHDLIVIAFADPYNGSLDPQFRSSLDIDLVGRRTQIISSGEGFPATKGIDVIKGKPVPKDITLGLGVSFAAEPQGNKKTHPSEMQLYVDKGKVGGNYHFEIWASNLDGEMASEYALLLFKNFHQISINDQNLMLVDLKPNEEAIIEAGVRLSDKPGIDQVQIVYLFDPYKSVLQEEVRAPFIFNSARLAIDVR